MSARIVSRPLVIALALAALAAASPAEAGHGRGHARYKGTPPVPVAHPAPACVAPSPYACAPPHHTCAPSPYAYAPPPVPVWIAPGPGFALSVGTGWVAGAAWAPAGYVYYDPWCGRRFRSVAGYRAHLAWQSHPASLRLVAVGPLPARPVAWMSCADADWDD